GRQILVEPITGFPPSWVMRGLRAAGARLPTGGHRGRELARLYGKRAGPCYDPGRRNRRQSVAATTRLAGEPGTCRLAGAAGCRANGCALAVVATRPGNSGQRAGRCVP